MASDLYTGNPSFALQGFRRLTSSAPSLPNEVFYCIQPIGGSATITVTSANGDSLTAQSIDVPIYGRFSNITVTSGTILAYIHA